MKLFKAVCGIICLASAATLMGDTMTTSFAHFERKAEAGERLTVAFFGASLTWGANASDPMRTSYRGQMADKLEARYPKAHFKFIDGAIGGANSSLAVYRLQRDCLAYKPDLVFLDFSANDDVRFAKEELLSSYESLVRRIITEGQCPLVMVIFPFKWDCDSKTLAKMPGRDAHYEIAKAYSVPVGDAIVRVQQQTDADPELPDRLWPLDQAHPIDEGYALFADAAWEGLLGAIADKTTCRAPEKMLHADTYMTWSRTRISQLTTQPAGWKKELVSRTSAWYDGLMSRWLDDVMVARSNSEPAAEPIKVKFRAATVLIFGEETVKSGKYRARIDGKPVSLPRKNKPPLEEFDLSAKRFGGGRQHYIVLAEGLDPEVDHELELIPVFEGEEVQELRLESICLAGGEARIVE